MIKRKKLIIRILLIVFALIILSIIPIIYFVDYREKAQFDSQYATDKINSTIYYELLNEFDPLYDNYPRMTKHIALYDKNNEFISYIDPINDLNMPSIYRKSNNGIKLDLEINKQEHNDKILYEKSIYCEQLDLYNKITNTTFKRCDGDFVDLKTTNETIVTNITQYENIKVSCDDFSTSDRTYIVLYTLLYFVNDILYVYQIETHPSCDDPAIIQKIDEICE